MKSESKRSSAVKPISAIEIKRKCAELTAQGKTVIDLGIGDTDFLPPNSLLEGIEEAFNRGFTHYTLSEGIPELRKRIGERYKVTENEVLVSAGGKEGLFSFFLSMVDERDEVAFPEPFWPPLRTYSLLCGAKPKTVRTEIENNFVPSLEKIKETVTGKTKVLIINSPNNPTGAVYPRSFVKGVAELADDYGFILLSDEIYSNYDYSGDFVSARGYGENVVVLDGFSKTFGMTGVRLGYLVGDKDLIKTINKIHGYIIGNAPSLEQYAGVQVLEEEEYMKKNWEIMRDRSDLAYRTMKGTARLRINKPKGAFYMFPRYELGKSSMDICKEILLEKEVGLTPGKEFGSENSFRIAFSQPRQVLKEGLLRIREYFEEGQL